MMHNQFFAFVIQNIYINIKQYFDVFGREHGFGRALEFHLALLHGHHIIGIRGRLVDVV